MKRRKLGSELILVLLISFGFISSTSKLEAFASKTSKNSSPVDDVTTSKDESAKSLQNLSHNDVITRSKRKSGYLTAYACEGSRLNINCTKENSYLHVIRANYGRFSIAICNDHGNTEWSVNCMSPRTMRVITSRCGNKPYCDVPVDSTIFGDPCPGTFKYVEVHYACKKEPMQKVSTPRPRPKWIPVESDLDDEKNNVTKSGNKLDKLVSEDPQVEKIDLVPSGPEENITPKIIEVRVPKPFEYGRLQPGKSGSSLPIDIPRTSSTTSKTVYITSSTKFDHEVETSTVSSPSDSLKVMVNFTQYCPPSSARGIFWNWTKSGDTAVLQCPKESTGYAKWRCGLDSNWATQAPSFAECKSLWLGDLDARLRESIPISNISNSLAYHSGREPMYGGDITMATKMLKHMSERMKYEMVDIPLNKREKQVTTLVKNVVQTGSNVIDRVNHRSWNDLSRDEVGRAATSLMIGLEENAFLLAETVTKEQIIIPPSKNILLSIRVMESRSVPKQRFPSVESIESWDSHGDSISISARALHQNSDNGAVRIVFSTYNQLDPLLKPRNETQFVNSKIIAASLGKGKHIELPEPVEILFKHLRTLNVSTPACVFWDYSSHEWSDSGCSVQFTNKTHTKCKCNHLTNFALLMSEGETPLSLKSAKKIKSHIWTIVAISAALVSVSIICFFFILAWRRFKMSNQCRNVLEKSGLPCFHNNKDLNDKDKGNKGNFYTVTPKLNGTANANQNSNNEAPEVVEAQQFFEHMISLQKNQGTLVPGNKKKNNSSQDIPQETGNPDEKKVSNDPNNVPKRTNYARALSPYNHIYMEIDAMDDNGTIYEPLTHSETYMMSTVSDMSEDNYNTNNFSNINNNYNSDVSRQSSSRESRPLIRPGSLHERNLLQTISGVLHSQSVRVNQNNLPPFRRSHETRTLGRIQHNSNNFNHFRQQNGNISSTDAPQSFPLQIVSSAANGVRQSFGHNTILGRLRPESNGNNGGGGGVPVQVTTMNGNQFVCLNINQADQLQQQQQQQQPSDASVTYMSASDTYVPFMAANTNSAKPGQIQAAVHSHSILSNLAGTMPRPRPQFAQAIRED